jgi:hypothetical protein
MGILQALIDALAGWLRPWQGVRRHTKNQAYGPSWSRHRPMRIDRYTRRRPRRAWRHGISTRGGA